MHNIKDFATMQEIKAALPAEGLTEISRRTGKKYSLVYQEFNYQKKRAAYNEEIVEVALDIITRETNKKIKLLKKFPLIYPKIWMFK